MGVIILDVTLVRLDMYAAVDFWFTAGQQFEKSYRPEKLS